MSCRFCMMPTLPFLKPINSANAMHLLNILESLEYVQLKVILQYELLQTVSDSTFFSGVHSMFFPTIIYTLNHTSIYVSFISKTYISLFLFMLNNMQHSVFPLYFFII